ncbi:SDR family NAD(P)-dependent oxidoreductase [Rhodoblastus sp.]|uniref:SDR family NAD(P)-dependent oxidoreductase n=1 Tax=Rhodoblastus sp. TaxID=1962975 RepID=UPI0035B2F2A9
MKDNKLHVVTGAAGFIGSQLVDLLLEQNHRVFGIDNFVRGEEAHIAAARKNKNFAFAKVDCANEQAVLATMEQYGRNADMIWHLAANSDIGTGGSDPSIDLRDTFMTTYCVAQACRKFGIRKLAFASTSAIYGDHGPIALHENVGPLFPISNYGAMKLASEACLTALSEAALDRLWLFRFPNVIGGRATHGVIHDFLDRLAKAPDELRVLGNGSQCKPYLYVNDLLSAVFMIVEKASERVNCFNIGPSDIGVTVREIAEIVVSKASPGARIVYGSEDRGWVGDVPRFHYAIDKLLALGWRPQCPTSLDAVERAVSVQVAERMAIA